ncbi:hypothetical protein Gotur_030185 [Gossypium turneri]
MEFVTDPDDQGSAMEVDDVDTPEIFGEGVIVPLTFKINAWNSTFLSCLEFDIIMYKSVSGLVQVSPRTVSSVSTII